MFRVTREIEFCYGHRLLHYDGQCRHLHGHNGRAVIALEGLSSTARGMLVDFGEIKQKVQHWIDENLDHNMLLCRDDPLLPLLTNRRACLVMDCNPTAENIARLIYEQAKRPACRSSKSCSGKQSTVFPRTRRDRAARPEEFQSIRRPAATSMCVTVAVVDGLGQALRGRKTSGLYGKRTLSVHHSNSRPAGLALRDGQARTAFSRGIPGCRAINLVRGPREDLQLLAVAVVLSHVARS